MKRLFVVGVALLTMLPMTAAAHGRGRGFVRPRVAHYGWSAGFGWYEPYYGHGWYPFYEPYFTTPNAGQVKLDTKIKNAEVYIDGDYAGTTGHLKTMTLAPGSYDIEIRAAGRTPFHEKIYVVAGKTMKLSPQLRIESPPNPANS